MRYIILILAISIAPIQAQAQSSLLTKQYAYPKCNSLLDQYENISKMLSMVEVYGQPADEIGQLIKQTKINTYNQQATILVALMQSSKCETPRELPTSSYYNKSAAICANAIYSGKSYTAECDMSTWKRDDMSSLLGK